MRKQLIIALLPVLFFGIGCGTSKKTAKSVEGEYVTLPELVVTPEPELVYNASATRQNDILHTKLNIKLDWEKQQIIGEATHSLTPVFYPTNTLILDAKGFEIKEVFLVNDNGKNDKLRYDYDGSKLTIHLLKTYKKGEQYNVYISYIAKPNEIKVKGSMAITEDKGFYFINPKNEDKEKPRQFWTQGETESNSCWFPTFDKPNERCTGEVFITVEKDFVTLGNGILVDSKDNKDGTRTDHWKQDLPHAPYLFMLAGGNFTVVKDKWREKEVNYYVEPKYAPYADRMWGNTPEMIEFFSNKLGVEFPWAKYSQIVIRDFVSGAMENTTAVTFFEGMNKTDREMLDEDHEDIIAHELFHHWFGDYVTCESWANLPLNESFATYGEYLWIDHKYGKDAADEHIYGDLRQYLNESKQKKEPLIRYYYSDKEDMFDAHSYQKGGRVLHMLRHIVGDEAFFASLTKYLNDNRYTAVEIHDLRKSFEAVTGQDLSWFFDQWFMGKGHPVLDISYGVAENGNPTVTIKQTQEEDPFILPMKVAIYNDKGSKTIEEIVAKGREYTHTFSINTPVKLINVDADKILLCEKTDNKTSEQFITQYYLGPNYMDAIESIKAIKKVQSLNAKGRKMLIEAMENNYHDIRVEAINAISVDKDKDDFSEIVKVLKNLATNDKKSAVRNAAVEKLGELKLKDYLGVFEDALKDSSYQVVAAGLDGLSEIDGEKSLKAAKKLEGEKNSNLIASIAKIYGRYGDEKQADFFVENLKSPQNHIKYQLCNPYADFLTRMDNKTMNTGIENLKNIAHNDKTWWVRYSSAKALQRMRDGLNEKQERAVTNGGSKDEEIINKIAQISSIINEIKEKETNEQLKAMYIGLM